MQMTDYGNSRRENSVGYNFKVSPCIDQKGVTELGIHTSFKSKFEYLSSLLFKTPSQSPQFHSFVEQE